MLVKECYIRGAIFWELNKLWLINVISIIICEILYLSQSNFELFFDAEDQENKLLQDINNLKWKIGPNDEFNRLQRIKSRLILIEEIIQSIYEKNPTHIHAKYQFTHSFLQECFSIASWKERFFENLADEAFEEAQSGIKASIINEEEVQKIVDIITSTALVNEKFDKLLNVISLRDHPNTNYYDIGDLIRKTGESDNEYFKRACLSNGYTNYTYVDLALLSVMISQTSELLLMAYLLIPENLNFSQENNVLIQQCNPDIPGDRLLKVYYSTKELTCSWKRDRAYANHKNPDGILLMGNYNLKLEQICTLLKLYYKLYEIFDIELNKDLFALIFKYFSLLSRNQSPETIEFMINDIWKKEFQKHGCTQIFIEQWENLNWYIGQNAFYFIIKIIWLF